MKHRQIGITHVGAVNPDGHCIGLDVGATAVRAAILAPGTHEGRPSVTAHGIGEIALPMGAVSNGVVVDRAAVVDALKQLWQTYRFECRNVIVGIASPQVVVRDMQMPNLSAEQRAKALPFQARDIVALPMDQVLLDFSPLGTVDPETNMINGLLVAAPRQPILAVVDAVERAGLKVARVDLAAFAALRSIANESSSVEAVIDIGARLTSIIIHNQGIPKVVRTVPRGGYELTDRLAEKMNLRHEDAELAKIELGLTAADSEISRALVECVRPLLAEIRSSIHYFGSASGGAAIERISLTGGTSRLAGLAEALADQIGVPTRVVTPMQHIRNRDLSKESEESESYASAVAVGLAMGAAA
jgi:type IV pilus assembly protein PilM